MKTWSRAGGCAWFNYPFLTSKERDNETGLDYFLARYYSSTQGRFTSPDEFTGGAHDLSNSSDTPVNPTFYADMFDPQSFNKYQYCYNNPLRFVDPDGHQPGAVTQALNEAANQTQPIPVVSTAFRVLAIVAAGVTIAITAGPAIMDANGAPGAAHPGCPAIMDCGPAPSFYLKNGAQQQGSGNQGGQQQGQSNAASPNPNDNDKKPRSDGPVFKTNSEAAKQAKELGFTKIGERVHGQAVFKNGNQYITRDVDGHNGGAWKVANSVKDLRTKASRLGTYDKNLKKIGS